MKTVTVEAHWCKAEASICEWSTYECTETYSISGSEELQLDQGEFMLVDYPEGAEVEVEGVTNYWVVNENRIMIDYNYMEDNAKVTVKCRPPETPPLGVALSLIGIASIAALTLKVGR